MRLRSTRAILTEFVDGIRVDPPLQEESYAPLVRVATCMVESPHASISVGLDVRPLVQQIGSDVFMPASSNASETDSTSRQVT